jgi:hypothetical protein
MCTSRVFAVLIVLLACRLVVGFVLEFVKSASLDRLHGLFLILITGIDNRFLARLSCIISFFVLILLLFLIFVYLFSRTCTILRTRNRDAFGFESFLDRRKLFEERGELLDIERDSLDPVSAFAIAVAVCVWDKDSPSFREASLHLSRSTP